MRAVTDLGEIQTFFTKYRPNKDPFSSKGLYYRPRSLNKDLGGSTALCGQVMLIRVLPQHASNCQDPEVG